ncbi:MAG: hypothetical protein HC831_02700 [Chloroflexia bacterium]|nr:hypothetical protein [Chloroflexia bacterium]
MKAIYQIFTIVIFFISTSCVFPNSKEREREQRRQDKMGETYSEEFIDEKITESEESNEAGETFELNTTDYQNIEISNDSLDLKLYELVLDVKTYDKATFLKNIETLIKKGANPSAMVETTYIVRKTGTFIPIIKHFYRNKYREHTRVTSSMHAAVSTGEIFVVEKLLELGGDLNIQNPNGSYPIDIALMADLPKMIDFLIEKKADLSKADLGNSRNTDVIEKLVKNGANPKTIDINYALNDRSELKRLLALKPDFDKTAFDFGLVMKDDELADLLFDNGLSPKAVGKFPDECPAIFSAIKYDNFRVFKKLHEMGANIKEECKHGFGDTPLQTAIYYQRIDVIKYLLEHKVSANEKDWTKKSVLIMAANTDNDEIVRILLDAGAELEYKAYFGKTPLFNAVEMDKYVAAECLIDHKANLNFRTSYGKRPIHAAIEKKNYPMIKLLIEKGAQTDVLYENKNLVEFAEAEEASPAIISYLKKVLEK